MGLSINTYSKETIDSMRRVEFPILAAHSLGRIVKLEGKLPMIHVCTAIVIVSMSIKLTKNNKNKQAINILFTWFVEIKKKQTMKCEIGGNTIGRQLMDCEQGVSSLNMSLYTSKANNVVVPEGR